MSEELGTLVAKERSVAGLTQKQLADLLGVHQSSVSRLERGQASPDLTFDSALTAIGTPGAARLSRIAKMKWHHLSQPSFSHPNIDDLASFESTLSALAAFDVSESGAKNLSGQSGLLFRRLADAANFLFQLDHRVNYVGEIGVGKTTVACRQAALVVDPSHPRDLRGMMLDTGGGRTTLCDIIIQKGSRFSFAIEPLPDDEVYRLAAELCRAAFEKDSTGPKSSIAAEFRPAEEIVRALRNMSGLTRPPMRSKDQNQMDPLVQLAKTFDRLEGFQAAFASRLTLWRRTRREIEFEGSDESSGRRWFKETFVELNNGKHSEVSLPATIVGTVPFSPMERTPFNITLMDTRGIDGSSIRPDIVSRIKDQRAITILCTKWGSAPDTAIQTLIRHVTETEIDPLLEKRLAILVLARAGDALSMRYESGENVEETEEGYGVKLNHVEAALEREQLPLLATKAFDSAQDDTANLTEFISSRIGALRDAHLVAANETVAAIEQMLGGAQKEQALNAFLSVNQELLAFVATNKTLSGELGDTYRRLLRSIKGAHPRTLWAATRRRGSYWNFDVYQHLGDGAADGIRRRSSGALDSLRSMIRQKALRIEYEAVHGFLLQLLEDVVKWEIDLVEAARHYAETMYKTKLGNELELWDQCERSYGIGVSVPPYRERVANKLEAWFRAHSSLDHELDAGLQLAWQQAIIEPLRNVAGENLATHRTDAAPSA